MTTTNDNPPPATQIRSNKLGEELPIFCERCGYNLNGLRQMRCEQCEILQFHCPECGHHQPINTLRPATQRVLGRLRAVWLCGVVLFKLNFFGWLLIAWVAMGGNWSYSRNYVYNSAPTGAGTAPSMTIMPYPVDFPEIFAFTLLGLLFGMVGRMLLLRWRRSAPIGVILAVLASIAIVIGAAMAYRDYQEVVQSNGRLSITRQVDPPWTGQFIAVIGWGAFVILVGTMVVWPIWVMFAHVFLPKNVSHALLEWQRSQSDPSARADKAMAALGKG